MHRIKKYALAVSVAAALVGAPTVAYAVASQDAAVTTATSAKPTATPKAQARASKQQATSPVRVVAPGERVHAAPGLKLWLTEEGKYWSTPDGGENFRSVVDGNLDPTQPGVSHQSEGGAKGVFHSGVYYGTKDVGRVEITDKSGTTTRAALVELPGKPGWGAWYAATTGSTGGSQAVTLYDSAGTVLDELPGMDY